MNEEPIMAEEVVRVGAARKFSHCLVGLFSATVRQATPEELSLRKEVAMLKEEVAKAKEEARGLKWELDKAQTELKLQKLELNGMSLILTWHENLWQTQIALAIRDRAKAIEQ